MDELDRRILARKVGELETTRGPLIARADELLEVAEDPMERRALSQTQRIAALAGTGSGENYRRSTG